MMNKLPIKKFKTQPYDWQLAAVHRGIDNDNFALFAEQGTGKTKALIDILRCRYAKRTRIMKTLILAPLITLQNWREEFGAHSFIRLNDIIVMKGTSAQKIKTFEKDTASGKAKILVTNYESLLSDKLYHLLLSWNIEILCLDEAHYVKNHKSKRSKKVSVIADRSIHKYILTGTPILNNVSDLYMQFRILDGGKTFGKSFYTFQGKYMMDMNEGWKGKQNYFPKFVANPSTFEELQTKMESSSVRVLKKDCLDLPPLIKQKIIVPLSPEQKKSYKEMERDLVTFIESKSDEPRAVVAQLAIVKALRLQQIVTGFVPDEDGKVHEFSKNPRLEIVSELLQQLVGDHKVILWCSFRHNYKQLSRLCKSLGIEYGMITGEQSIDQKNDDIKRFRHSDSCRVVIANRRAGGIGINLIEADYSIVYSRNFSLNDELQSEARNHRGGSEVHEKIVKIDLVGENTIDEKVLTALQCKQDLSKSIIDVIKGEK